MRISDIKGERVYDVIAEIIEPIANIAEDKAVTKLFARETVPEGMTAKAFVLKKAKQAVPVLLKNHKKDLTAILAAIEGEDPQAFQEKLTMPKLVKGVVELLTDNCFEDLFFSAQATARE